MADVCVYIDGFNLYYGSLKDTTHKWLNLDALCRRLLPEDKILRIKYFTARVKARSSDPGAPVRQQMYLRALGTIPHVEVIFGRFLTHKVRMLEHGSNPPRTVCVVKTEEKGSDVNLACHLLLDGFRGHYERAVVVSNDSDLAEAMRMLTEDLGREAGLLTPREYHSRQLAKHVSFKKRIRESDVAACQFSPQLKDSTGTFNKPAVW